MHEGGTDDDGAPIAVRAQCLTQSGLTNPVEAIFGTEPGVPRAPHGRDIRERATGRDHSKCAFRTLNVKVVEVLIVTIDEAVKDRQCLPLLEREGVRGFHLDNVLVESRHYPPDSVNKV